MSVCSCRKGAGPELAPVPVCDERPWCVVRTAARHEKIVARLLTKAGIPHFLATTRVELDYCGQRARVERPLFPGIVFARGEREAVLRAAGPEVIRQITFAPDQQALDAQIRKLSGQGDCASTEENQNGGGGPASARHARRSLAESIELPLRLLLTGEMPAAAHHA